MALVNSARGQAEVEPWGNIKGIRVKGQLFDFESSIKVISKDWLKFSSTGKEQQRPHFKRNGDQQVITSNIDSLFFKETVDDLSEGTIKVSFNLSAHEDITNAGVYFCIKLPVDNFQLTRFRFSGTKISALKKYNSAENKNYTDIDAEGIEFKSKSRQLNVLSENPELISVKRETSHEQNYLLLFVALNTSALHKGDTLQKAFTIKASGNIDKKPVQLVLNTASEGRAFDGLGGNFRLQNPKQDPQVIDYCLKNLRVAWGRVEMPWRFWQPFKDIDPVATADSGKLHPQVIKAIEMAKRLDSLGIPVILSAWFPPAWAAEGKINFRPVNGVWGNPLNKNNMVVIYKSIADYIQYLKVKHGVEIKFFSFNESDLGINVRVTPQQHDEFIKGCGAYFASRGLKTKMLLGDNSDATTYTFINPSIADEAAHPYIGAVSFHSWRGWETPTLKKWAEAAAKLNRPLIVGEGSIDAAAYSYPDIFQEQHYALNEINLYTRLLAICQPLTILQWQLTADYSPLIGGGIFGNNEPLHPGQRFYNLKQLSITPKGLFAMPVSSSSADISCAALGDNTKNSYAIHLVNNGATRKVTLAGLPLNVKLLHLYCTNKTLNMQESGPVKVKNGKARFELQETSYVTLMTD